MDTNHGLPLIAPKVVPELHPNFSPAVLANRAFRKVLPSNAEPVLIALERADGSVSRFETKVYPANHPGAAGNFIYLERFLKFLLWSRGGWKIHFAGPADLAQKLQAHYRETVTGKFDAWIMGEKIYEQPFTVALTPADKVPAEREITAPLGRHLEGCRIGFDLGASDRKVAAVKDGQVLFSEEVVWNPVNHADPQWHFDQILDSLRRAATHLPRVDGVGGSSAGVYVNNRVKVASLFRKVPDDLFKKRVKGLFLEIQKAMGGIPFEVVNDGEVTALAGAMALQQNGLLGVAMGSSQAAGYVNNQGNITTWLNELAFVPIDYHPAAPVDEWSKDYGCGVQYFSQQCVGRLVPKAGLEIDPELPLPEKLVQVQAAMAKGDERAAKIYRAIGIFLGYTLAHYTDFYSYKYLLLLGRVTTGAGGSIIINEAKKVLQAEFPDLARHIVLHVPDEKEKRHGQAIAAASLPVVIS
jgi:predicted NBD/HSP70 family sugar kinase